MKNFVAMFLVLGSVLSAHANNGVASAVTTTLTCEAGSVMTLVGCLPQDICPAGYGLYQNNCFPKVK